MRAGRGLRADRHAAYREQCELGQWCCWASWSGCAAAHPEGPSVALEELCPAITEALCSGREACCTTPAAYPQYVTDEECRSIGRGECEAYIHPTRGDEPLKMAFDGQAAAELLARFENASRDCTIPPRVASVQMLLSPSLREGALCVDDRECPEELVCIPDSVDSISVRRCRPPAQVGGAPCLIPGHCSGGRDCKYRDGWTETTVGTCDWSDLDESCSDQGACRAGLTCRLDYPEVPVCVVPGNVGEPCSTFGALTGCADGLSCSGDISVDGSGFCAERLVDGETCNDSNVCRSNVCASADGLSARCAACTEETCDGTCVDGACVWARQTEPPRQRWPWIVFEFRADGATCESKEECAGRVCGGWTACGETTCSSGVCGSLPVEATWCEIGIYSRTIEPWW